MDDEVPPCCRTLDGSRHWLGFTLFEEVLGLAFHCVKVLLGGSDVITAFFGLVEKRFEAAVEMFVNRQGLATAYPFKHLGLGSYEFCNERIRVRVTAGLDLLFDKFF